MKNVFPYDSQFESCFIVSYLKQKNVSRFECRLLKEFIKLAEDNTSGATELIHQLLGVSQACIMGGQIDQLKEGIEMLSSEQLGLPSFHAVLHTLKRDLFPLVVQNGDSTSVLAYIESLQQLLDESVNTIAAHFLTLLRKPRTILTMSRSQTVMESIFAAHEAKKVKHIYVMESRPMCEGIKTIRDFSEQEISATLIVDAAMSEAAQLSDFAIVGADGISADGFLLNKTGTNPLAIVCSHLEKPLYVLCDTLKFSPQLKKDIIVEDQPVDEVVQRIASDRFQIWNKYFDWTPMDFVTAFITEKGIYSPDKITQLFST